MMRNKDSYGSLFLCHLLPGFGRRFNVEGGIMMWRRLFCFLAVMVALCVTASAIHAKDRAASGAKDFKIGRWHSHFSRHTFKVDDPCDGAIVIKKNTPEMQIWKGYLFLNRRYIPLREFFAGDETIVQIERPLKSRNRLMVFLVGTPGASVRIAVRKKCKPVRQPTVAFSAAPMAIHARF